MLSPTWANSGAGSGWKPLSDAQLATPLAAMDPLQYTLAAAHSFQARDRKGVLEASEGSRRAVERFRCFVSEKQSTRKRITALRLQVAARYGRAPRSLSDLHLGCGQPPLSGLGTLEWLE